MRHSGIVAQKVMACFARSLSRFVVNSKIIQQDDDVSNCKNANRHFFKQKFAKDVEKLFGPKGKKLFEKRKDKNFVRQVDDFAGSMRGFQTEPGNLKEYSPWLSGFKADTFGNDLEIPGLCLIETFL